MLYPRWTGVSRRWKPILFLPAYPAERGAENEGQRIPLPLLPEV
jgi:hypothetical protein